MSQKKSELFKLASIERVRVVIDSIGTWSSIACVRAHIRGDRTCSRASVEEFNLMSEFCYFSLFWLDYGQLKKLHTANSNSSTHADWAHAF